MRKINKETASDILLNMAWLKFHFHYVISPSVKHKYSRYFPCTGEHLPSPQCETAHPNAFPVSFSSLFQLNLEHNSLVKTIRKTSRMLSQRMGFYHAAVYLLLGGNCKCTFNARSWALNAVSYLVGIDLKISKQLGQWANTLYLML